MKEQVVAEPFHRLGYRQPVDCQRRHRRKVWKTKISVIIENQSEKSVHRRRIAALTQDISIGGFSFLYRQYIPPGSIIHAHFDMLPMKPTLTGVVRSCVLLHGMEHRVGIQFTGADAQM